MSAVVLLARTCALRPLAYMLTRRHWPVMLSSLVPAALLFVGGLERRWIGDDGFINLRVVSNLLAGHGFVFNVGERIEAVTSPLWIGLLALLGALGAPLNDAAVGLGLLLSGVGVICATLGAATASRAPQRLLPAGLLVYVSLPAAWDYATSGLENGLSLAWLGTCFLWVMRAAGQPAPLPLGTALLIGCGPLVRPDLGLVSVILGVTCLGWSWRCPRADLSRLLTRALGLAAPALAYQVFRMGYFAALVPNTALAKEAFGARWEQGWYYLANSFHLYMLWVPLAILITLTALLVVQRRAAGQCRQALVTLAFALAGLAHLAYVVRVGGDFMHARLLLPGLFALLLPTAVLAPQDIWKKRPGVGVLWLAPIALWAMWCASSARVARANEHGIGDERGWHARQARHEHPIHVADYTQFFFYTEAAQLKNRIAATCPSGERALEPTSRERCEAGVMSSPGAGKSSDRRPMLPLASGLPSSLVAVVARPPLGIASAVLGLRVGLIDPYGLADPVGARLELGPRGRPGHEKRLSPAWIAARFAAPGASSDPSFLAAQRALACGELAELVNAVRAPLTRERFVANLLAAPRLHRLRVPPSPVAAERKFCFGAISDAGQAQPLDARTP